ncbi:SAM-dependent DNA methyltransferase, partial [Leuconostoc falkenbergense]|nr:SAM-dependent DNA methyltransferase [Leuconostoc falkenbergense]
MKFTSEKVNELLGVDEAFKVPNKLMSIMMNREQREQTFKAFLEVERDTSFDWFHEYFESEQSERKT